VRIAPGPLLSGGPGTASGAVAEGVRAKPFRERENNVK